MCEGTIEFDACFHHEFDEDVVSFESQPKGYKYHFEGKELPYTPDAVITFKDQTKQYIEYKAIRQALKSEFKVRFKARNRAGLCFDELFSK
ncbi:TnsA endonuclease N-terminal domain-containing protein [Parashewanella spongiae]